MLTRRNRCPGLVAGAALGTSLACLLLAPMTASADTTTSENWSGYAAHRSGVRFRHVIASWRQPAAACTPGEATYSAFWVGIGGYSRSSDAMEQVGTELDCNADGTEALSGWYELLPAPNRAIRLTIAAGDLLTAAVAVSGRRVTISLVDETRHESFVKTIEDHTIDTTSAEWIAEAPSDCSSSAECSVLPLADFGAVRFASASAETSAGRTGAIASAGWSTTRLLLGYTARGSGFVAGTASADATPSALGDRGRAFRVSYTGPAQSSTSTGSSAPTSPTGPTGPGASGGPGGPGGPGGSGGPPS